MAAEEELSRVNFNLHGDLTMQHILPPLDPFAQFKTGLFSRLCIEVAERLGAIPRAIYFATNTRKYWYGKKVCSFVSRNPLVSICLIRSSRAIFICIGGPMGSSFL
jgi:hypothetical protein